MHMAPIPTLIGLIRGDKLRAIGVTGPKRSPIMPEMPTATEDDLPGYEAVLHYGLLAPAGTPRSIVEKLSGALRAALADEEIRKRILDDGGEPTPEHAGRTRGRYRPRGDEVGRRWCGSSD